MQTLEALNHIPAAWLRVLCAAAALDHYGAGCFAATPTVAARASEIAACPVELPAVYGAYHEAERRLGATWQRRTPERQYHNLLLPAEVRDHLRVQQGLPPAAAPAPPAAAPAPPAAAPAPPAAAPAPPAAADLVQAGPLINLVPEFSRLLCGSSDSKSTAAVLARVLPTLPPPGPEPPPPPPPPPRLPASAPARAAAVPWAKGDPGWAAESERRRCRAGTGEALFLPDPAHKHARIAYAMGAIRERKWGGGGWLFQTPQACALARASIGGPA